MQIYRLKINNNICIGCNDCVVSCPINFQQLKDKGYLTKEKAVVLVKNVVADDIYDEDVAQGWDTFSKTIQGVESDGQLGLQI